tara:strand:- start:148 stop:267 length:120 start_codon:yes stop_codon:yes gene_type:complete
VVVAVIITVLMLAVLVVLGVEAQAALLQDQLTPRLDLLI